MSKEEFAVLAEKYMDTVYRVAYSWTRNPDDANDVTQDVFIQLYKTTKEFESDSHLKNWLMKVTVNQCKMLFRSPWNKMEDVNNYAETLGFEDESYLDLFRAVMKLDKKYRVPLMLFYYEGYSTGEIASILSIPEKTVSTRLFRARAKLKDDLTEVLTMSEEKNAALNRKKHRKHRAAMAAAALAFLIGSGTVAYAMDLGGIQRIVQVWIHGDQTDAVFTTENGTYTLDYTDAEGNGVHRGGGGVAFNPDGTERPLTEEELWDHINAPEVTYEDDGTVWVYYLNQKLEITDKFEDGICYLKLNVSDETMYMTIKYQNGYAMSPHGYIQPEEFN